VAKVLCHEREEVLEDRVRAGGCEALKFLLPTNAKLQPCINERLCGTGKFPLIETLREADVMQNVGEFRDRQMAEAFGEVALEGAELSTGKDT
jgi:hypothetical protein